MSYRTRLCSQYRSGGQFEALETQLGSARSSCESAISRPAGGRWSDDAQPHTLPIYIFLRLDDRIDGIISTFVSLFSILQNQWHRSTHTD